MATLSLFSFTDILDRHNTYLDEEHLNIKKEIFWKIHSQINFLFAHENEILYVPHYTQMTKAFDVCSTMQINTNYTIPKDYIPRLFKLIADMYQSEMA